VSDPGTGSAGLAVARPRAGLPDWLELCKPRLNSMVVATAAGGAWLGSAEGARPSLLLHVAGGTALVAAGASALNMVMERHADALMVRTRGRPLPAGRIAPAEATAFGATLAAAGLAWLALGAGLLPAALAAFTLFTYLAVYTPMKGRSAYNTLVGAVTGAVPPVIGWTASAGRLGEGAWVLFAILYLWQIPHFLAIAWLHRDDYRRAGLVMLPGVDGDGRVAAAQATLYAAGLTIASLAATTTGLAGGTYFAGAILLGAGYTAAGAAFALERSDARARRLLHASLLYLPLLLLLLGLDRAR
jgi:protoheme IX farnesyltransferase